MTVLANYAGAALAVVHRDMTTFFSYRTLFLTQLFGSIFSLTIFYYVAQLVQIETFPTPESYFGFVVVGLVIGLVLQSALSGPTLLRQELVAGTFERMLVSPLGPVGGVLSMMIFPLLYSIAQAAATFVIAATAFGLSVEFPGAFLAVPVAIGGALAFASMAMFFVAIVMVFKQGLGMSWVTAGITLVSGVYFPIALLPGWLRWASDVQPFTATVELTRHLLIDTPLTGSVLGTLVTLVAFISVLAPLGCLALTWAVQISRRRGTIIEY